MAPVAGLTSRSAKKIAAGPLVDAAVGEDQLQRNALALLLDARLGRKRGDGIPMNSCSLTVK